VTPLEDRTLLSSTALAAYGQLPLAFEANQGQADPGVAFLTRGNGGTLSLSPDQAVLNLQQGSAADTLTVRLLGANPQARAVSQDPLITKTNYLIGSDPSQWRTNIPNYSRVEFQDVYPGVDLVYYGNQGHLEYDFVVAAGADPGVITLSVQGAQGMALDPAGNLVLHTAGGDVVEQAPVVYQSICEARESVPGRFLLEENNQIGFQIGAYDRREPLVIDPVLSYSSYLGAIGTAIAVDSSGSAYVTGLGNFVDKVNPSGTALTYRTYLGSGGAGAGIAVDSAGDAYVTGTAGSNFPTTPNAFAQSGGYNYFTELNAAGSGLIYSTFLPGTSRASLGIAGAIAINSSGNAYLTGAAGAGFPTTPGAFQTNAAGAFFAEINPSLFGNASLVYATYLGGTASDAGTGIAVDSSGNAYLTGYTSSSNFPTTAGAFQTHNAGGYDAFVAKLNPALSGSAGLVYSTYLGGSRWDGYVAAVPFVLNYNDQPGPRVAIDSAGNAYVTGSTRSTDFPTTAGAFQTKPGFTQLDTRHSNAYVAKLNPTGTALVYSTYLGGNGNDGADGIAVDSQGNVSVAGWANSTNFPTKNPIQATNTGNTNAIVTTLNASGSALLFSTYLGGPHPSGAEYGDYGFGIALDAAGNVYVTGQTASTSFPTTPGAFQPTGSGDYNGFIAKNNPAASGPSFVVAGFASPTTAGVSHTFTVTALNADGTVNTGYTGTVHFTSSDPQAVLPADYTFTAADLGTHTFTATLKTAGGQSIAATDTGTYGVVGTESGIAVQPAAATKFVLSVPTSVTAGVAFSVTLTVEDAYGNVVTGYTGTVHFSSSDNTATLPADYTFNAGDAGVHTWVGVILRKKGNRTLTVTDTLDSALTATDTISVG
jgi:hypothetical protein